MREDSEAWKKEGMSKAEKKSLEIDKYLEMMGENGISDSKGQRVCYYPYVRSVQ